MNEAETRNVKLAVIEAKSDELEVGGGVAQVKDYIAFQNNFKEALGLVFQESGYKEHYEEMIK